jgi:ATP synthase subunit 6
MLNINNLFVYNSPLEQFIVFNFFNLFKIEGVKLTNLAMNFFFVVIFIVILFYSYNYKIYESNNKNFITTSLYNFIKGIFKENVNLNVPYFFSYIFFVFLIIFSSNLLGLVPFSFTITSSIIFTFFFSIGSFININITGFRIHGLKFFNIFLPKGATVAIAPFLVIIEFISYNARVFSLAIRLFANMMSGHILLKILATAT